MVCHFTLVYFLSTKVAEARFVQQKHVFVQFSGSKNMKHKKFEFNSHHQCLHSVVVAVTAAAGISSS